MRNLYALSLAACLSCAAPSWAHAGVDEEPSCQPPKVSPQQEGRGDLAEAARLNEEVRRLYQESKLSEALPLAERVVGIREKILGAAHPLVASAERNLAAIYNRQGKPNEAESHYRRAFLILEKDPKQNGVAAADVANQLAGIRFGKRDYDGAENFLRRSVELLSEGAGPDHIMHAPHLLNLADFYLYRDHLGKAEPYLARAFTILEAQPPRLDAVTATQLKKYICALRQEKKQDELRACALRLINRMEHPEKAAEYDKWLKEGEAKGEDPVFLGEVLTRRSISKPAPDYPEQARQMRVSGTVVVKVTVDETGRVSAAEALCGHPALVGASETAVRRWRFTPTLLSGKPIKVTAVVSVDFHLR